MPSLENNGYEATVRDIPMLDMKRCHEILEIRPGASPVEVKQAFRDLVTIWHPDRYCHNPRLMEKADLKLKEINWAWEQFQAFSREQERAEDERRQGEQEEAERQRRQRKKSMMVRLELRPADLDMETVISADLAQQAYRARLAGTNPYCPDPGLAKQEEDHGENVRPCFRGEAAGHVPVRKTAAAFDHRSPDGRDSLQRPVQVPGRSSRDAEHEPHGETETEISRKMTLLSECYVQGRRERDIQERHEREKIKRALEERAEKTHREQKQKLKIFTERYLDGFRSWLADEKVKFHSAEHERQRRSGLYRVLRGVEMQKDFPYGISHIRMIFLHGGTYAMGMDDRGGLFSKLIGYANSHPRHTVGIRDFYLSKYPVTEKQWSRTMGMKTSEQGQNMPVRLSWSDVQKFISKLNSITGLSFRLPTEAEWEYAARSGGNDEKWPEEQSGSALFEHAAFGRSPVGLHQPTGLGLYDMLGNVGEWSGDWYDPKYYASSVELDPGGPERGDRKVIRGNVYFDAVGNPVISDSFSRNFLPVTRFHRAGFRLAHPLL